MHFIILLDNNSVIQRQSKINTKSVNNYHATEITCKIVLKRKAAVIRLQARKPFGMTAVSLFIISRHCN